MAVFLFYGNRIKGNQESRLFAARKAGRIYFLVSATFSPININTIPENLLSQNPAFGYSINFLENEPAK